MVSNRRYYWNCGHQTKTAKHATGNGRICCPICMQGSCMTVKVFCIDCGKDLGFHSPKNGSQRKYCPDCARLRRKVAPISRRFGEFHNYDRRHDCLFYDECLDKAAFSNRHFDCKGCNRYKKKEPNVLDYVVAKSSFTPTGRYSTREGMHRK